LFSAVVSPLHSSTDKEQRNNIISETHAAKALRAEATPNTQKIKPVAQRLSSYTLLKTSVSQSENSAKYDF